MSEQIKSRRFPDLQPHIEEQFFKFHSENPNVYFLFKRFATEARSFKKRFGAKAIAERIRWEVASSLGANQFFKLNNNFPAVMARMLIEEDPSFKEFFELRRTPGTVEMNLA